MPVICSLCRYIRRKVQKGGLFPKSPYNGWHFIWCGVGYVFLISPSSTSDYECPQVTMIDCEWLEEPNYEWIQLWLRVILGIKTFIAFNDHTTMNLVNTLKKVLKIFVLHFWRHKRPHNDKKSFIQWKNSCKSRASR